MMNPFALSIHCKNRFAKRVENIIQPIKVLLYSYYSSQQQNLFLNKNNKSDATWNIIV